MADRYFLGLDVGSTASKCVIINESGDLVSCGLHPSGAGTLGPKSCVKKAIAKVNGIAQVDEIASSCATGYGRHLESWTTLQMSELSCHAKGAVRMFEDLRTVIDIGGQDAKVLSINDNGQLESFVMNDKCAAGTGRFLDVMAGIFGCSVSDLSDLDKRSTEVASISSTCTVFAESEVISKLAAGVPIPDIAAGVHLSVVERTYGLAKRAGIVPRVAMTGGVALNESLRMRLEARLDQPIATTEHAQFVGAYGAALFALEKCK